jgi:hypothetical protein
MNALAAVIACYGLFTNSTTAVIGAMVVAIRSEHSETEQYAVTSTVLRTRVSSRPRIRERHQRRADDIGELRGGIEDGGRERAFRTRELIAGDLELAGNAGASAMPSSIRRRSSHQNRRHGGECRGYRPEGGANTADRPHPETVKNHPGIYVHGRCPFFP